MSSAASDTDEGQVVFGEFVDADTERAYRESRLVDDIRWGSWIILLWTSTSMVFASSDYKLFGWSQTFAVLLTLRVGLLVFSGFVALRARRTPTLETWNRNLTLWSAIAVLCFLFVNNTRPASYTGHSVVDVLVIITFYLGIPLQLKRQLALCVVMSLGGLAIWLFARDHDTTMQLTAGFFAYAIVNVIGASFAKRLAVADRRRFWEYEHRVKAESIVDAMSTLLPICAGCKAIHSDEDDQWHPVEDFLSKDSDRELTHGYCPSCDAALFPDSASQK